MPLVDRGRQVLFELHVAQVQAQVQARAGDRRRLVIQTLQLWVCPQCDEVLKKVTYAFWYFM